MTVAGVIWSLNMLIQSYACWLVLRALRAPYRFPRWRWEWGLMGMATGLMLVQLLYNVLWLSRSMLETYVQLFISLFLALSLYQARKIYSPLAPLTLTPPAMILIDETSVVLAWNAHATRLFGWTEAEALGQPLPPLIMPEAAQQAHYDGVARWLACPPDARPLRPQYFPIARTKQGAVFQVEVTITALPQPDGRVQFLGSIRKLFFV